MLTELEDRHYILKELSGEIPAPSGTEEQNKFRIDRLVDHWEKEYATEDKYALELKVVKRVGSTDPVIESIGFLSYTNGKNEIYLLDEKTGIGFTMKKKSDELIHVTKGKISEYTVAKTNDSNYVLTKEPDGSGQLPRTLTKSDPNDDMRDDTSFPAGTMITLIAKIESNTPTYRYYYCTDATEELPLTDFIPMNRASDVDAILTKAAHNHIKSPPDALLRSGYN